MKYEQDIASETKVKITEAINDSVVSDPQLPVAEAPDSSERAIDVSNASTELDAPEITENKQQELFGQQSAKSAEKPVVTEPSDFAEKKKPPVWLFASVPMFFSISLITTNIFYFLRHIAAPHSQPWLIDVYLLLLFMTSYLLFRIFCIQQTAALNGALFKARPRTKFLTEDPIKKYCKDLRKRNEKDNRPETFLALTSQLRHGPLGSAFWLARGAFYTITYFVIGMLAFCIMCAAICNTNAHQMINSASCISGLILSCITFILAFRFNNTHRKIINTYNFALLDPKLKEYVELPPTKASTRNEITVDFDAFADIERWVKHRFSQKSRKKTIFMCCLVVLFFAFNGFGVLENSLRSISLFLVNAGGLPGAAGTGTSFTQYTINYFNLLLSFLGLGGISAAVYAMLQPTHLRLTNDGVSFLYKRRPFGKVRFTPWSKIKQLRILSRKGTTMLGDKQLEFRGDRNALIKFKLNCIDSISSREAILKGIESWAPNVKRDADVIQTLQRPPEQSYTDLWLQALVAPPKRDRLKPLITNSSLQDGHYSVVKTIGLGGQGTAYLARDTKTSQLVVLKEFILPIYVDINVRKAALERFENEARILKGLDCAQIVKLVDFFVEDHRGYLALEYIDGEDLKTKVERNGKLTEKEVLNYAIQMCEILNYLHKQVPPVIHRDFTPDNLILQLNGSLKLIDFNVAQQTNDTITGTIVGKQCYLPPEQFQGEPVIQSDIYSMGATLFFLATGSPPSPISQSHPKEFNSELSKNFDDFVARATTIDTGLRYTSATECLEELKRILNTGDKA